MKKLLLLPLLLSLQISFAQHFQLLLPSAPDNWPYGTFCDTAFGNLYFSVCHSSTDCPKYITNEVQVPAQVWYDNTATFFLNRPHVFYKGKAIYCGFDSLNGWELWQTDGTEQGSGMLKNLHSNPDGNPREFTLHNNLVYFIAHSAPYKSSLWVTDGTDTGTHIIKSFSGSWSPTIEGVFKNKLWLVAEGTSWEGVELWYSDGTTAGTQMIRDIDSNGRSSVPANFLITDTVMYFSANDSFSFDTNRELWKTDGTTPGTVKVKEIDPRPDWAGRPIPMVMMNGKLFLRANDGVNGDELWVSDGTDSGTYMLKNINPTDDAVSLGFGNYIIYKNLLYFSAHDSSAVSYEIWTTDGTEAGTVKLLDSSGAPVRNPRYFKEWKGKLYFSAYDENLLSEMWVSDGTAQGTHKIVPWFSKEAQPFGCFGGFTAYKNALYFTARYDSVGCEVYRFTDSLVSGMNSLPNEDAVSVFPNPFSTMLTVKFNTVSTNAHVILFDIGGKEILREHILNGEAVLPAEKIAAGFYFVSCTDGVRTGYARLVKF